jgi:hypothetical protein
MELKGTVIGPPMEVVLMNSPALFLYSEEPTQSYKKFPNREAWLNGFMAQTLDNCYYCLKDDGILAVNIAKVSTFPDLEDAFMSLATSRGRWRHIETLQLALSPMWGTRKPGQKWKLEPIFVFSRRGKRE